MRMREMMAKHGAGGHTPEETQRLMSRVYVCMNKEVPHQDKYPNIERI